MVLLLLNEIFHYPPKTHVMASTFASSLYLYAASFLIVVLMGLLLKLYYAASTKNKFKEYQSEIARSHSRILKLEVKNDKLEQYINELQSGMNRSKTA